MCWLFSFWLCVLDSLHITIVKAHCICCDEDKIKFTLVNYDSYKGICVDCSDRFIILESVASKARELCMDYVDSKKQPTSFVIELSKQLNKLVELDMRHSDERDNIKFVTLDSSNKLLQPSPYSGRDSS